jgi:RNA polymerase sigma-70 factor (ECF subfamily)
MGHHQAADEQAAFAWFFTAEYPQVVRLLAVVVRDGAAAEDLAQDAFVRLHRNWSRISSYDSPEAWVRRVALNLAFSWRRREGRRRHLERAGDDLGAVAERVRSEVSLDVRRAVAALPKRERALVALYHLEDRPIAEVADLLGMTPGAVKVGLHRARRHLSAILEDREVTP